MPIDPRIETVTKYLPNGDPIEIVITTPRVKEVDGTITDLTKDIRTADGRDIKWQAGTFIIIDDGLGIEIPLVDHP